MSSVEHIELLTAAAKAAGYAVTARPNDILVSINGETAEWWNPLTDDGDEARLEAALQMHVEWHPAISQVRVGTAEIYATEPYGTDRQAARRQAGVRAAVEIGRN